MSEDTWAHPDRHDGFARELYERAHEPDVMGNRDRQFYVLMCAQFHATYAVSLRLKQMQDQNPT